MDPQAIQLSVGASPARNRMEDQQKITALLNSIDPGDGGPTPKIDLSVGPPQSVAALAAAIRHFQEFYQGRLKFRPDGRVDPNGSTWRLLKEIAGKQHGAMGVDIPEAFPGVDISWWNDVFIKWIKDNTNFLWIGYYLPYAKYSEDPTQKAGWKNKFEALKTMGWFGVAPVFYGMQPREARRRSAKEDLKEIGKRDGALAASLSGANAIPKNTTIFCDREGGDDIPQWVDYYAGWVTGLVDNGYWPGLYGTHLYVDKIVATVTARGVRRPEVWAVNVAGQGNIKVDAPLKFPAPAPRKSGASTATSWQYTNGFQFHWAFGKVGIDMDSSVYSDPGRRISPYDRI